ncbi:MAG TPA: ABC transporter ATP-binding protein [Xanthobacteraceae bacterium]|nr:ABC transporter ATP-binding protein [Xanthobacteraceae bacterium]
MTTVIKSPPLVETKHLTKRFGNFVALSDVSIRFTPGSFHALLGENGAGKSTLVKAIMGYHVAEEGSLIVDGIERSIDNPKQAQKLGLGMVYQHFTLVPSMTVAENLVLSEERVPQIVNWREKRAAIEKFMAGMPFKLALDRPISSLAAGEKQKLEILKQLYIGSRFLILDEPTSVLTPSEADEVLSFMKEMTLAGKISVVLISHKLREVDTYASDVSVLRQGRLVGGGKVKDMSRADMVSLMIGRESVSQPAARTASGQDKVMLEIRDFGVMNDRGVPAVRDVALSVSASEIVGIAGVSGNGQTEFVEALAGQRELTGGGIEVAGERYDRSRACKRRLGVHILPEVPLRNACVGAMSVADNLALRNFDQAPFASGFVVRKDAIRKQAEDLIRQFGIKTRGPDTPIKALSGGNVQRAVLARELSAKVNVLVVQNPCFGLDLHAVSEIRNRIVNARNEGAAVLLISEDLDEILELSDRILVMAEGRIVHETPRATADVNIIGRYMASHHD